MFPLLGKAINRTQPRNQEITPTCEGNGRIILTEEILLVTGRRTWTSPYPGTSPLDLTSAVKDREKGSWMPVDESPHDPVFGGLHSIEITLVHSSFNAKRESLFSRKISEWRRLFSRVRKMRPPDLWLRMQDDSALPRQVVLRSWSVNHLWSYGKWLGRKEPLSWSALWRGADMTGAMEVWYDYLSQLISLTITTDMITNFLWKPFVFCFTNFTCI